ncbi:MAG TPA: hypothetical protein VMM18_05195 [Gemmatimonadaceae bacterium]|nr:hypothetical protein [Gemmatimonadaceae bacterium]
MFRAILLTQWKWSRLAIVAAIVLAFTIPILSVQRFAGSGAEWIEGRIVLQSMRAFAGWYALLASAVGLGMAVTAWSADHRGRHVYALSLPVPRWQFALMRFGAGALMLLLPALALWAGALLATSSVSIPAGMQAFPGSIAVRFLLGSLVIYSLFFAIASGTARTAGWVLGGLLVIVALVAFDSSIGLPDAITNDLLDFVLAWPRAIELFTGRWMLIDV